AAAVLGLGLGLLIPAVRRRGPAAVAAGGAEGAIYAGLGGFGGVLGAVFFGYVLPPEIVALLAFMLAAMSAAGVVLGLIHGTGGAARKVLGVLVYLALAALFALLGVLTWDVEYGPAYVGWLAVAL